MKSKRCIINVAFGFPVRFSLASFRYLSCLFSVDSVRARNNFRIVIFARSRIVSGLSNVYDELLFYSCDSLCRRRPTDSFASPAHLWAFLSRQTSILVSLFCPPPVLFFSLLQYWSLLQNRFACHSPPLQDKLIEISTGRTTTTQNRLAALLPSLHSWWPWLRLLHCACACSTILKERGKWLQLRFNIPNIPENKRNVKRMLKHSLKAFKLFQHRSNILSTRFNKLKRGWQTLSTLPFNKIERMLKQMLKPFARAFRGP